VLISSDKTKEQIEASPGQDLSRGGFDWTREKVADSEKTILEMTHCQYFETVISDFARKQFPGLYDGEKKINFHEVDISDLPTDREITMRSVEAAEKILKNGEAKLYIDFNGGQRHVAFMLLNISNLLKLRHIKIREILVMNYENRTNGFVKVEHMNSIFKCMDLSSGLNEYINYGRIKMLKSYFAECYNKEIREMLDAMETFSNSLQLCRTSQVFTQKRELKTMLDGFIFSQKEKEEKETFEILFSYVVNDILEGYGTLLSGELPEVINWCVEKDFIQQALTFYVERMPIYFWESGVFAPAEEEERQYEELMKACKKYCQDKKGRESDADKMMELSKDTIELYKGHYRNYDSKYSWFVKYLPNKYKFTKEKDGGSTGESFAGTKDKDKERQEYKNTAQEAGRRIKLILYESAETKRTKEERADAERIYDGMIKDAVSRAIQTYSYIINGRAQSNRTLDELMEILICYELLRQQRNKANHADDSGAKIWPYDLICRMLKTAVSKMKM